MSVHNIAFSIFESMIVVLLVVKLFWIVLLFGSVSSEISHLVTGVGSSLVQLSEETPCYMLHSGKYYKPEMSEVAELLKAWKEERAMEKQECEEERRHYTQECEEERICFEE